MSPRLQAMMRAFDARSLRERLLLAFAALAALYFVFHLSLLDPAEQRAKVLAQRIAAERADIARESPQIAMLENQLRDREGASRAQLDALKQQLEQQNDKFKAIEARLVPARDMPRLLQGLLARRPGLQLVSLRSLPPEAVTACMRKGCSSAAWARDRRPGRSSSL